MPGQEPQPGLKPRGQRKYRWIVAATRRLLRLETPQQLAALVKTPWHALQLMSIAPAYDCFTIKKAGGGERLIEAPREPLKNVLSILSSHLQAVYYIHKTPAAYGYVYTLPRDVAPRNILTNALAHRNSRYMLNIDLKDFFHQVSTTSVHQIFSNAPFRYPQKLALMMAHLTTFNGRLPMGSPTSPPLSNFAMLNADKDLLRWAAGYNIKYTRYVDDLTFSSQKPIEEKHLEEIDEILHCHRMKINYEKVKFYGRKDEKIVTGLLVGKHVEIPPQYFDELDNDLERLRKTKEMQARFPSAHNIKWIKHIEQVVMGKINFVGKIYGYNHERYQRYYRMYEEALHAGEEIGEASWLDFDYEF